MQIITKTIFFCKNEILQIYIRVCIILGYNNTVVISLAKINVAMQCNGGRLHDQFTPTTPTRRRNC